jgi:predicted ribosome quality control (RQC) complex YloA/Tae2 family protein
MLIPRRVTVSYYLSVEYQKLLAGRILRQVSYRRADKMFLLAFGGEPERLLEFSFAPPHFLLRSGRLQPEDSFEIWSEIAGSQIEKVSGRRNNRIIDLNLAVESPEGSVGHWIARFELFGPHCNAYLLDDQGQIVHATRVLEEKRKLKPGMVYSEPSAFKEIGQLGEAVICETEAATYMLQYRRHVHRVVAEVKPGQLSFKPDHRLPLISLFQGLAAQEIKTDPLERKKQGLLRRLKEATLRVRRRLQILNDRLARCADADKYRRWADLLMANPHAKPNAGQVVVQDLFAGGEATIPLPPGKNLIESATAYYKIAGKLDRAPEFLEQRIKIINKRLAELEQAEKNLDEITDVQELETLSERLGLRSTTPGSSNAARSEGARPYRTFVGPGGEKILVGKSAADNDTLTFKVARSYDYWFHTQQSRGSHVILVIQDKNSKPNRPAIETAAALAAFYSDERQGNHVPVIFTPRRHVRKARKGTPGLVIPDRVESIFVDPGLPPQPEKD